MPIPRFFTHDQYILDEKVAFLKFENSYTIRDLQGDPIGFIQQEMSGGQKALRLLVKKQHLPFTLHILDDDGQVVATIQRGATLVRSNITVSDGRGEVIGYIKQKFTLGKPVFTILDANQCELGQITGNWRAWDFAIDVGGRQVGQINKQWNGVAKELFSSADRYLVSVDPALPEDGRKVLIIASAVTIDMVLKESS
jgi:uncharacterized protein YxjI